MTSKQRAYLRGIANSVEAIFQVGKNGINDNLIKQLDDALEARELIKISVLETAPNMTREVADMIAAKTNSEVIQIIGSKFCLYRQREEPTLMLPK